MCADLVDIDYASPATWDQYIREDVMRVYKATSKILGLFQQAEKYSNLTYDKLDDNLKRILLGGVIRKEDGSFDYTRNSSAKFYAHFFGLIMDYSAYLQSLQLNTPIPIRLMHGVSYFLRNLTGELVPLIDYIRKMNDLARRIIASNNTVPPEVEKVSLSNLDDVLNAFKELFESLIRFTSVYNPRTFFVTSLTGSTLKSFLEAYEKLNDENVRNIVFKRFGVDKLLDLLKKDDRYAIYGYRGSTLGRLITDLDKMAYNLLRELKDSLRALYTDFIRLDSDIESDFKSLLSNYLSLKILGEEFGYAGWKWITCDIDKSNPLTVQCENGYFKSDSRYRNKTYTLMEMLDEFSIFLLLYYDLEVKDYGNSTVLWLRPKREVNA